jgi:hypothetical protein
MGSRRQWFVAAMLCAAVAAAAPTIARADDVPASSGAASIDKALLEGLGKHATHLEEMKARGEFTLSGKMEALDDSGHPTETKELVMRSTPTSTPHDRVVKVVHYAEDGKDKTAEAQTKADERRAKRKKANANTKPDRQDLKMPFLPSEQARYVFSLAERDAAGGRVRIAFAPKTPAEDAIKGSAWVDERTSEVLTMGFSFSKNPIFVDHVEVTLTFGLSTQLGRAPSKITFDGRGGFLFVHKHYRGEATISDPKVVSF